MEHRVEPFEVCFREVADVFVDLRDLRRCFPEIATRKDVGIKPDHFIAGRSQDGRSHGPDVAFMASQQYFHYSTPVFFSTKTLGQQKKQPERTSRRGSATHLVLLSCNP